MLVRAHSPRLGVAGLAFALVVCVATPALARISGIGLIDYSRKTFKVGDWVRYKIEVSNSNGREAVNYQEVRIAGEEVFRGEPCIWVETWFGPDSANAAYDLTLLSADAFKDPQADVRFSMYARMMMLETDEEGAPEMTEIKRAGDSKTMPDMSSLRGQLDTLGTDKVETFRGPIEARMVRLHRKIRNPRDTADSTVNRITDLTRTQWMSKRVPITSLVKEEETEDWLIQAYKLGEVSTKAPEVPISSETRKVQVIGWGTGVKSNYLALWRKKREQYKAPVGGL